jgi:hypothetical protein
MALDRFEKAVLTANERWLNRQRPKAKKPAKRHPWRIMMSRDIRQLEQLKERQEASSW